jgi:hypothetical protein
MKGLKRVVFMVFIFLAFAVVGYADEKLSLVTSQEEIPVWNREGAKKEMTASNEKISVVHPEEEIPVWTPGLVSQKNM